MAITTTACCPITGEPMKDPVIDKEGNTYERSAIVHWLQSNQTSPITRSPLRLSDLVPNRALLDTMSNENGIMPPTAPTNTTRTITPPPVLPTPHEEPTITSKFLPQLLTTSNVNLVKITPPKGDLTSRIPSHVILVIDVSGSMGASADAPGTKEPSNLSVLDITKHAAKTVIGLLGEKDRLSVISYHDQAKIEVERVVMNDVGKVNALAKVNALVPQRSTNLWDGLDKAMLMVKNQQDENSTSCGGNGGDCTKYMLASVLLLTDGQPNVVPPRGHLPMVRKFLDANPVNFTLNTFGFGYNLDSKLLLDLAIEGGGNYSFIPDSGFVGTVFVHAITNILCTYGQKGVLSIEVPTGVNVLKVLGAAEKDDVVEEGIDPQTYNYKQLSVVRSSWGVRIDIGSLQFDEMKVVAIVLDGETETAPEATLSFYDVFSGDVTVNSVAVEIEMEEAEIDQSLAEDSFHVLRLQTVDAVTSAMQKMSVNCQNSVNDIANLVDVMKVSAASSAKVRALLTDVQGQISEAVSTPAFYNKWGRHYLPSIARSHLLQNCTNFKDPGLQGYGAGELFSNLRDEADDIFMKMPPPTPSRAASRGGGPAAPMSSTNFTRSYYNSSNGCMRGDGLVKMYGGFIKKVEDVQMGDVLSNGAVVRCVVKTLTDGGRCDMVRLPSGLYITPYHPIKYKGEWAFPKDVSATEINAECKAVYSFVLNELHSIEINGVECIGLGHGIVNDAVASHPYLGTEKILKDLDSFGAFETGLVVFNFGCMKRGIHNDLDNMIIGFHAERLVSNGLEERTRTRMEQMV